MDHTPECIASQEKWEKLKAEYKEAWPNHCRTCKGWGLVGPGGYEKDTGELLVDPCSCVEKGLCPRCGNPCDINNTFAKCFHCRFDPEVHPGIPNPPECFCWMEELDQAEERLEEILSQPDYQLFVGDHDNILWSQGLGGVPPEYFEES